MNLHLSSLAALLLASYLPAQATVPAHSPSTAFIRSGLPIVDLDQWTEAQVVVDKEKGKYLGHPTTLLLKDGKTILCVYPKGHGSGEIILKKSTDGGKTWSERLPVPESWKTSREVPTLYETEDSRGKRRILLFSGIQGGNRNTAPRNRMAVSEDNGTTWSELTPISTQAGGIVVMSDLIPLNTGKGHYMASYHANARGKDGHGEFHTIEQYVTFTEDGGLTWTSPQVIFPGTRDMHLCEGGFVRSPDGKTIALLLRENSRHHNSQIMFSEDEGKTWTPPKELPAALCGDRHQILPLPDGRLLVQFRDAPPTRKKGQAASPTEGDWVAWIGRWEDLKNGTEGSYKIRFKDNRNGWDCAYPAAELLPDHTLVCTTYGHFDKGELPYILSVRFKISDTDKMVKQYAGNNHPKIKNDTGAGETVFDPNDPDSVNRLLKRS